MHALPPELAPPLAPQHFSIKGRACAGLDCPTTDLLVNLAPDEKSFFPVIKTGTDFVQQGKEPSRNETPDPGKDGPLVTQTPTRPFPFNRHGILCFCLDLYAVLHVQRDGGPTDPVVSLKLDNSRSSTSSPTGSRTPSNVF